MACNKITGYKSGYLTTTPDGKIAYYLTELIGHILNQNHTLIAGTTGSGKSVVIEQLISLAIHQGKSVCIIDPKRIDLVQFRDCGHVVAYGNDLEDSLKILRYADAIMRDRYEAMQKKRQTSCPNTHMYVFIDELADLMISERKKDVIRLMQSILQLGRAANVHIIAATQAPNRKVIPAELVLNFTARLGLRCLSPIESRQIIGINGCEKLPEHGRALYLSPSTGIVPVDIPMSNRESIAKIIKKDEEHDTWELANSPDLRPYAPSWIERLLGIKERRWNAVKLAE